MPLPLHRSFSQLQQYRTCSWQFKLERVDRVDQRPSCAAVAGTVVHTGTETVDQLIHNAKLTAEGYVKFALDDTIKALDAEIEKRSKVFPVKAWKQYGKQDMDWFREVGIPQSIQAYVDWRLANPDFVLAEVPDFGPAIEVPFWYYCADELIHGFIDRVFTSVKQGGYYPVDLKSGLKPKTDEQLGLYGAALNSALGWQCDFGYYIFGLKTGVAKLTPPISLGHWTEEKLSQVYAPAGKGIELGLFIPSPGEACFHCSVTDSCDFYQAAI